MAQKPHEKLIEMADAFDMADRNVQPDAKTRRTTFTMGAKGLPRTPAQQASVKKAAQKSAAARSAKAAGTQAAASLPTAVAARVPNALAPAAHKPGISTGGLGLASRPKGGLLR